MKRILSIFLALVATSAFSATLNPVQLLNPAGSSAGQAIISTGPSTAPTWGGFSAASLTGIVPIANGGTGASSAAAALSNLGGLSTTAAASTYLTQANAASTYGAKASPLSQFAATTSAQLAGVISDETGTGSLVLGTSPTITTPNIVGVTNGSNATAGSVGEFPTPTNLSGVSISSATATNAASIPLSAGEWDVSCTVRLTPPAGVGFTSIAAGISTTTNTLPGGGTGALTILSASFSASASQEISSPVFRMITALTTTAYCVGYVGYASGAATQTGFIRARRVH